MLVHVGSQDYGLGTPSRYLARMISWTAYKLSLLLCHLAEYQHGKQAQKMTDGMNLLGLKTANMPRSVL